MNESTTEFPETLAGAIKYFASPDAALNFVSSIRWPDGKAACPCCKSTNAAFLATRRLWKCRRANDMFNTVAASIPETWTVSWPNENERLELEFI